MSQNAWLYQSLSSSPPLCSMRSQTFEPYYILGPYGWAYDISEATCYEGKLLHMRHFPKNIYSMTSFIADDNDGNKWDSNAFP